MAAYRAQVRGWHTPPRTPPPGLTADGRFPLRLYSINGRTRAEIVPSGRDGGFDEAACAEVSRIMEDHRAHTTHPVDRRLVEVVYEIARHFHAPQVSVVSGYREGSPGSHHHMGRAIDIVIPGVRDEDLAAYARTIGFLGVGTYPMSGFVHVDVRNASFFWVDGSAPGRSHRIREVRGTEARRADEAARTRGVTPLGGTDGSTQPNADGAPQDEDGDDDGPT